ncbi:MAG: hypothetical protein AAFR72_06065 [Pseudomonadota bacterium]
MKRCADAALLLFGIGVLGSASMGAPRAAAQQILLPTIETRSLTANAFETGTLDPRDGAMAPELWVGSDPDTLSFLLDQVPNQPSAPALGTVLRRVLLSPGRSPVTDDRAVIDRLSGQKLLALINAGFIADTRTLVSLSDAPANDPATGQALATADLATGVVDAACRRGAQLQAGRDAPYWVKLRAFCYAVAGERDAADLTYGLLRDRGLLTERDEQFLGGFVIGLTPDKPLQPRTALELAITRALDQPLAAGLAAEAHGVVVRAVTLDEALDPAIRIHAARRALGMGMIEPSIYAALLSGVPLNVAERIDPAGLLIQSPNSPRTEAALYQQVQAMAAPEFLRDKASLIANALRAPERSVGASGGRAGGDFDTVFARHQLYAGEIANLEGALVSPEDAAVFARARLAVGDSAGAGRWLFTMLGEQSVTNLGERLGREFVTLTQDLAILDPAVAALVADRAQIEVDAPFANTTNKTPSAGAQNTATSAIHHQVRIVEAVFDAAMGAAPTTGEGTRKKTGQAALAALAMTRQAALSPVERVVAEQAIDMAGLGDLRRQWQLQTIWQRRWGNAAVPAPYGRASAAQSPRQTDDQGLSPRVKPRRLD